MDHRLGGAALQAPGVKVKHAPGAIQDLAESGLLDSESLPSRGCKTCLWEYVDSHGEMQGPFSSLPMSEWFCGGMLPADLALRLCGGAAQSPVKLYELCRMDNAFKCYEAMVSPHAAKTINPF